MRARNRVCIQECGLAPESTFYPTVALMNSCKGLYIGSFCDVILLEFIVEELELEGVKAAILKFRG